MEYWLSHKNGRVIEQIVVEDGDEPRWSEDSDEAEKVKVERLGDPTTEIFSPESGNWTPCPHKALHKLKEERRHRLEECDYPPLYERPEEQQPAWKAYRQALRDLPENTDPLNPEWPEMPTFGK